MRSRLLPASVLFLITSLAVLCTCGCSSGRIGGLYLLNGAVAVEDAVADWQQTVLVKDGQATHYHGTLVPTTSVTGWLVIDELAPKMHMLRTSKMRPEQRFPVFRDDHCLYRLDLDSGKATPLSISLDTDDEQVRMLRLDGDWLLIAVGERYNVQSEPIPLRYVRYHLPDGPLDSIAPDEVNRIFPRYRHIARFADFRTDAGAFATSAPAAQPSSPSDQPRRSRSIWNSITSFQELQSRGLARGDWGELTEREFLGRRQAIYISPQGKEITLFR